jgi:hypothetical protein
MRKQDRKKLALDRETVRHLTAEHLTEAQGQGAGKAGVQSAGCDPACKSQTLSCTL